MVCVKARGMKEAWRLAAGDDALPAAQIDALHGKRWTINPSFRDTKDLRFGMGMSEFSASTTRSKSSVGPAVLKRASFNVGGEFQALATVANFSLRIATHGAPCERTKI